jgi:hypothetical protein
MIFMFFLKWGVFRRPFFLFFWKGAWSAASLFGLLLKMRGV